jgi:hypothetical protein
MVVFKFTITAAVLSLLHDMVLVLDRLHAMGVICQRLCSQILSSPNGREVSLPCMETLQASNTCLSVHFRTVCLCDCSVFVEMRRLKLAIRDPSYSTSATSVYLQDQFRLSPHTDPKTESMLLNSLGSTMLRGMLSSHKNKTSKRAG